MKLKIDVEIDWLGEDGSIDEIIQDKLAESILSKVKTESTETLLSRVEKLMQERVNTLVQGVFESLMTKEVAITDHYGDVVKTYPDVNAMIKDKFDKFLTERVDSDGRTSSYGDQTRMDLIVKKQLDKISKEFTTKAVTEVTNTIKSTLSTDLKDMLGDRLMNLMEIDTVLNSKKLKG